AVVQRVLCGVGELVVVLGSQGAERLLRGPLPTTGPFERMGERGVAQDDRHSAAGAIERIVDLRLRTHLGRVVARKYGYAVLARSVVKRRDELSKVRPSPGEVDDVRLALADHISDLAEPVPGVLPALVDLGLADQVASRRGLEPIGELFGQ